MRKSKKLEFRTKKSAAIAIRKRRFLYFCIFTVFFGIVSMLVLLNAIDFNLSNLFEGRKDETQVSESTTATDPVLKGNANFLVCCASKDGKDLRFIAVINADLQKNRFMVCAISPNDTAHLEGNPLTLHEHFSKGGATQLKKAIETNSGIRIDKYICSNDTGFKAAIKSLNMSGKLTLNIEKMINYDGDELSFVLGAGVQTLTGDVLLNYFRYNGQNGAEGLKIQAQTICAMLDQYLIEKNTDQGEKLYNKLKNTMTECDISAFDYNNNIAAINLIAGSKDSFLSQAEQDLSLFTGSETQTTKEGTTA